MDTLEQNIDSLISSDVTFRVWQDGLLASNHRARTHVWMNPNLFDVLLGKDTQGPLQAADMRWFSNTDGLLSDPTCLKSTLENQQTFPDMTSALAFLKKHFILVQDGKAYERFFAKRTSLLDKSHFGTFHQQLGTELRMKLRQDPQTWWYQQKFDPKTGLTRNNLYKFIQESFLDKYFDQFDLKGKTVLDFGCGSGMASEGFIKKGAHVIGVDPDKTLLEKAKTRLKDKFTPILMNLADDQPLSSLPEGSVDFVWLADVFIFYFYPQDAGQPLMKPGQLLQELTKHLQLNGSCVIMQPHGFFWLAPWLGEKNRPFTVLTEYAKRIYSVSPSLEEMSNAIHEAGLAVRKIYEPKPAKAGEAVDPKAYAFAQEFPLWWVFETIKIKES